MNDISSWQRVGIVLATTAATASIGIPAGARSSGARPDHARFVAVTDLSPSHLAAAGHASASVQVRLADAETKRPVKGSVWLVDDTGVKISASVRLDKAGRATVSWDPAPGTHPGRYGYRVRFGGNATLPQATSRVAATFRIDQPPRDESVDGSFIAAPDYLNQDVGDLSAVPGWTPAVGNSWNVPTQDSINWVLRTIAGYHPDAFLVTGDLVNGRWGDPDNTTGVFGTSDDLSGMLTHQADFYYQHNMSDLRAAGLDTEFYPAVGDHELGDNWWNDNTAYGHFKRTHLDEFRDLFHDNVLTKPDGSDRFTDHPVGTAWDKTAYAAMINRETLLVTVDEFSRDDANQHQGMDIGVYGGQLRWLDHVLGDARRRGVRWIIVQGHTPILPAKVWHSSGLHVADGRNSPLWQTMKKHHVNLYIAGEVHTTSRRSADGITQLVTGAPLTTGELAFATVNEYADRLNIQVHAWDVPDNAESAPMWQGGCPAPEVTGVDGATAPGCTFWSRDATGNKAYGGIPPKITGSLTVYLGGTAGPGTGTLVPWDGIS